MTAGLDADSRALLAARRQAHLAAVSGDAVDEIRETRDAWRKHQPVERVSVASVEDRIVGVQGGTIAVRIYRQTENVSPAIVYFHGGGWVLGDLDHSDALCRRLCVETGFAVINVDYRLAPEHRFPTAALDCVAATRWAVADAALLGIDPERIAVAGSSAGGNLAAAVTIMARDGVGPMLRAQILLYPALDNRCAFPSFMEFAEDHLVSAVDMKWYWEQYLGEDGDASSPLACPLKANDLRHLPPALVITAECDPIRDDGEHYARQLQAAGVAVEATRYEGVLHGFVAMPGVIGRADDALAQIADFLSRQLGDENR